MRIDVQRHSDVRMSHQILGRLGIHAGFRHIAAVSMAADVRRDVWHLYPVNLIIPLDHMVEPVFPVHRYQWHPILIREKETSIATHYFLKSRLLSILDDRLEAPEHIFRHGQLSCSCIGLGRFNDIFHFRCPEQLMVNVDDPFSQINVL